MKTQLKIIGCAIALCAGPIWADPEPDGTSLSAFPVTVSTYSAVGPENAAAPETAAAPAEPAPSSDAAPAAAAAGATGAVAGAAVASGTPDAAASPSPETSAAPAAAPEPAAAAAAPAATTEPLAAAQSAETPPPPPVATIAASTAPALAAAAQPTITTQALAPPLTSALHPVTLDLKEMDVVEVVKMLAKQNNLNLILNKNVTGRVTLLLNNVEFWEALKAILNSRDLAYVREGNLVEIMTSSDYERLMGQPFAKKTTRAVIPVKHVRAKISKDMLETLRSKVGTIGVDEVTNTLILEDNPEQLAQMKERLVEFDVPRAVNVFRLNYASVEELEPKLMPFISKESGSLQIDKRSNSLVVEDNPARLHQISEMVKAFDVRNRCVLIEAKIMQVIVNKSLRTGVNWQGVNWSYVLDKLNGYHVAGNLVQNLQLVPPASLTPGNVTANGITASVGVLEKPDFKFIINLLGTIGTTKLLSSPRIMALNNHDAKIHVGSKAAKITKTVLNVGSTTSNAVVSENVEFLDTGVKLSVRPSIGDDGMVTLIVKPQVSSVENTITTSEGSSIPIIRVSEAEASLVVKDGVTVVIGGLIEENKAKTDNQVPFFGRIPLLGYLFRSRQKEDQKTELVIFLTPHIVDGTVVPPEAQRKLDLEPDGAPKKKGFFKRLFGRKAPGA